MQKIKDFWINSYKSDKIAFSFELVSFIFTVGASMTLAITAKEPNMLLVYPAFLLVVQHNAMHLIVEVPLG